MGNYDSLEQAKDLEPQASSWNRIYRELTAFVPGHRHLAVLWCAGLFQHWQGKVSIIDRGPSPARVEGQTPWRRLRKYRLVGQEANAIPALVLGLSPRLSPSLL